MKTYRLFRIVWGLVFLASVGWLILGFAALGDTSDTRTAGGAMAAGSISLVVLCTGGLPALLAGLLYWRNGVGMRHAREHAEVVAAIKGGQGEF